MKIGIIGLGFVGGAMFRSFKEKEVDIFGYDKYNKTIDMGPLDKSLNNDVLFLCLPTLFDKNKNMYNKDAIYETCKFLNDNNYKGIVVLKSTVEPQTVNSLCDK